MLGHADPDHRGAAPALDAPVYCHQAERAAAESDASSRPYFDLGKLRPYARPFYAKMLPLWDGGAVSIAGTVAEGDAIADFRVIELPGHAPGLIGLFRESDRLALVSDTVYTLDIQTGNATRRRRGSRTRHSIRAPSRRPPRSRSWPSSSRDRLGRSLAIRSPASRRPVATPPRPTP